MISPAGCTVRKLTMPFCRSITIKAAVVSSFVIGMVSFRLGGVDDRAGFRSSSQLACFFRKCTLDIVLITTIPAKKVTTAELCPLETFPTRNRM
jgi:hypothetical protein